MSGLSRLMRSQIGWNWNQPAKLEAHLPASGAGLLGFDLQRLAAQTGSGAVGHQLRLRGALQGEEPPGGAVDGLADGEYAVVAQNHGLVRTERPADPLSLSDDRTTPR
jgi:hypothetical protein